MTATHSTASTALVAIDISKHRHEALICIPGKKRRCRMTSVRVLSRGDGVAHSPSHGQAPVRHQFFSAGYFRPKLPSIGPSRPAAILRAFLSWQRHQPPHRRHFFCQQPVPIVRMRLASGRATASAMQAADAKRPCRET